MAFRAWHWRQPGPASPISDSEEVAAALRDERGLIWVDFTEPTPEDGTLMSDACGLHQLSVQDCLSMEFHPPRLHDFSDYVSLVLHGIDYRSESWVVETTELMLFVRPGMVVSSHKDALANVDDLAGVAERDGSPMMRGSAFLAYLLVDSLTEHVFPVIDRMSAFADEVEEAAIRKPEHETLDAIIRLKRSASTLSRILTQQRDMLNRVARDEAGFLAPAALFFRDVYDRVLALEGLTIALRERAQDTMATYLSSVANRQNESMKVLAILATAFLPMGLLAGIYGMNFAEMPGVEWSPGFYVVMVAMAVFLTVVVGMFWLRSWITWGHRSLARSASFLVPDLPLTSYASSVRFLMVDMPVRGTRSSLRLGRMLNPLRWW